MLLCPDVYSLVFLKFIALFAFGFLLQYTERLELGKKKRIVYGGRRRKRFGMPEDYGWECE